jgi:hypothetical protein
MSRAIRKEGDKGGEEDVAKSRPVDASGGGRSRSNQPEPTEAAAIAVDRSGGCAERSASVVEGAREGVQVQAQVGQDTTVCDSDARREKYYKCSQLGRESYPEVVWALSIIHKFQALTMRPCRNCKCLQLD